MSKNMCFCTYFLSAYNVRHMKKYITILIGIAVLFVLLYGVQTLMKNRKQADVTDITTEVSEKSFVGQVVRVFEGEHVLEYSLSIPETASTTVDMNGALIKITDEANLIATMYMSYEGGRGYTPLNYIHNVIAPHVPVINPAGTTTIGMYDWQVAESEGSEWYIAQVANSQWLIVVENKKATHDTVNKILTSINVK